MFGRNELSDRDILKTLTARIARTGTSQSKISAIVQRGTVTLSGSLFAETQRMQIVKTAGCVAGVRTVIDQMKVTPKRKI
jgi:osmotically-inducible protein OsmY